MTVNPLSNFGDDENDRMPWQQDEYSEADRLRDAEIARLRTALEWTVMYYGPAMQEVGCPCNDDEQCPMHTALAIRRLS